jgi:hypothetical protein
MSVLRKADIRKLSTSVKCEKRKCREALCRPTCLPKAEIRFDVETVAVTCIAGCRLRREVTVSGRAEGALRLPQQIQDQRTQRS